MTKSKLDLDFSDISGNQETSIAQSSEQESQKVESKSSDFPSGIKIVINNEEKDLAFCSREEFKDWCQTVMPGISLTAQDLKGLEARTKTFRRIVTYSQYELFTKKRRENMVN